MRFARIVASSLVVASCTSPVHEAPAKQDEPVAKAEASIRTDEATADAEHLTEAEAKAVFDAWLTAQTEGDFDAYAAVYADDFKGIKRNGHELTRLERKAWLESRRKSFERGFSVTATGLEIEPSKGQGTRVEAEAMIARFTQRWSTPSFADIGPKQLVIAHRSGRAKIVREEMLESQVTRRRGRTDPPLMVLDIGGTPYVLLGDGKVEWIDDEQPARLLDEDTVTKPLVRQRVSRSMLEWLGAEVEVVGESEARCKTTIAALEIVGRVEFSHDFYDDLTQIKEAGGEASDEQKASASWSMIAPNLLALGKLDGCTGRVAVPLEATVYESVTTFSASRLEEELAASAREAFVTLKGYRQEQRTFVEEYDLYFDDEPPGGKPGPWDTGADTVEQLWVAGDERFLFRSVSMGDRCEGYTGSLWALWHVGDGDALEFVASGPERSSFHDWGPLRPTRLIRWHDSMWLLTEHELYELRAKRHDGLLVGDTEPVVFECGC